MPDPTRTGEKIFARPKHFSKKLVILPIFAVFQEDLLISICDRKAVNCTTNAAILKASRPSRMKPQINTDGKNKSVVAQAFLPVLRFENFAQQEKI